MEKTRKPEKPEPPKKDPVYLPDLLRYHKGLTREEALEMIEAFGGL
jgi:hypothetical protein